MLLLLLITFGNSVKCQGKEERWLRPYQITPSLLDPTEELVTWPTPKSEAVFKKFTWLAEYVGLLWAGRLEFPWIVELRVRSQDRESRAVGLLANQNVVVTTCQAVNILLGAGETHRESDITIVFTEMNLKRGIASREVKQITKHPLCQSDGSWSYDIAAIMMDRPIREQDPVLRFVMLITRNKQWFLKNRYMPLSPFETRICEDGNLICWMTKAIICYVASFGKPYVNIKDHKVVDFKVKFRAYIGTWSTCRKWGKYVCKPEQTKCQESFNQRDNKFKCLTTRALVGAVCDHDRGAPVICNGQIYGFVAQGALFKYCNNRLPIPFFVAKLDPLREWLSAFEPDFKPKISYNAATAVTPCCLLLLVLVLKVNFKN